MYCATAEELCCYPFMRPILIVLPYDKSSHIQSHQSHAGSRSPRKQVVSYDRWAHLCRSSPHHPKGLSSIHSLCCTVNRGDGSNTSYRV